MPKFYCEDTAIPNTEELEMLVSVGNSMICRDIWHKYHARDISKLFYVISLAVRRVKFETILKYHKWYLYQI